MSDTVSRFAGPGQWYAQAKRLQAEHAARHGHDATAATDAPAPIDTVGDDDKNDDQD